MSSGKKGGEEVGGLTSSGDAHRARDGCDLGVLEQARVGGEPEIRTLALGQESEAVPASETVSRHGDLRSPGHVAQVVDGRRDLRVGHLGRVVQ